MTYEVELLGGLRVRQKAGAAPVTQFRTRKTALLLAYLALQPTRRHSRDELIELFWPDLTLEAARDNLSGSLSSLRRQFGGGETVPLFEANRDAVWLSHAHVMTDVAAFERELDAAAKPATALTERRAHLESALARYQGPLLPEVYEEWALAQQTRLAQRYGLALAALAEVHAEVGATDLALATAHRAQQADLLAESAYQTEMRVLAGRGETESARRVYERFARLLERELGCRPSSALQKLTRNLDDLAPSAVESEPPPVLPTPIGSQVPAPLGRFWGREAEVARLLELLQDDATRLVTITGPGGIGKTHLSLVTAARLAEANPNPPLFWVPLADVTDLRLLVTVVQRVVGSGTSPGDDVDGLVATLTALAAAHGVVLLLDNLEHLIGDDATLGPLPALVRLLLERVPRLTILSTSRRILGLAGEQELPLGPLPLPSPADRNLTHVLEAARAYLAQLRAVPSVALFSERAQLVQPSFALTVDNADAVAAICRRLEGIPLALEIAASWVRTLPLSQMRERLDAQIFALQSRRRDLPPRHRSLQATVAWSWELLDAPLRRFFLRLCVFRGGCTLDAAQTVAGDGDLQTLDWLSRLQEHSLLTVRPEPKGDARYVFLEPIRQWGLDKLAEDAAAYESARQAHADYFQTTSGMFSGTFPRREDVDEQNCLAACQELLRVQPDRDREAEEVGKGLGLACQLTLHWYDRGLFSLAHGFLTDAVDRYRTVTLGTPHGNPAAHACALHYLGGLARMMGRLDDAEQNVAAAKARYEALGESTRAIQCEGDLGAIATSRGNHQAAARSYQRVVDFSRATGNDRLLGVGLTHLAIAEKDQGNWETAQVHYDEALGLLQGPKDALSRTYLLLERGVLFVLQGKLAPAQRDIADALELTATLNNPRLQSHLLATAAAIAVRNRSAARAARLNARAGRLIEESGSPLTDTERRARALVLEGVAAPPTLSSGEMAQAQAWAQAATFADMLAEVHALAP